MLIIGYNGVTTVKAFREYKAEQQEAIALERAELEEKRLQTEKMLQELQALKAQLGFKGEETKSEEDGE